MFTSPDNFHPGEEVKYLPAHTKGDLRHPDVETGYVSSTNEKFVFVKYIRKGNLQETAQATDPRELIKVLHIPLSGNPSEY